MAISFSCATCGKPYVVDERFAGKKAACRMCGNVNLIPSAEYAALRPNPLPNQPTATGARPGVIPDDDYDVAPPQTAPGARPGVIPDDFDPLPLAGMEQHARVVDSSAVGGDDDNGGGGAMDEIPMAELDDAGNDDDADDVGTLELLDEPPVAPRVKAVAPVTPLPVEPMPARRDPRSGPVPVVPVPPGGGKPLSATPLRALPVEGCPNCGEILGEKAIFCTACGYNLKTGKAASTAVMAGGHDDEEDEDDDRPRGPRRAVAQATEPPREPNPTLRSAALFLIVGGVAAAMAGILVLPMPALAFLTSAGPLIGALLCMIGAVIYFIDGATPLALGGVGATAFSLILLFALGRKSPPPPPPPPPVVAATLPATQPDPGPKVQRTGPDTFTVRKPKPGENVIEYWRPVLADADPGIRLVAIEQLRRVPAPWTGAAVDEIVARAEEEDVNVRRAVMTQVPLAATPKSVAAAIKGLDDADAEVRSLALAALASFKSEQAIAPLVAHYSKLGDGVLNALAGYPAELRPKVVEGYKSILSGTTDAKVRTRVMGMLVKAGPDAAGPLLVQYVGDNDADVRALAMGYLGEMKYPPGAQPIVERLATDIGPAARALVAYGPVAEKALDDKLAGSGGVDAKVRLAILGILKETATGESLPLIETAAKDPDLSIALAARQVWRRIDPTALAPMDEALMDLGGGTKEFTSRGLAALKAMPVDEGRRGEVAKRLWGLLGSGGGADADLQNQALDALMTWADDSTKDAAIAALRPDGGDEAKRAYAMKLAVHFKDARAVKPLVDSLSQSKSVPEVTAALAEFGTASEEYLIKLLASGDSNLQANVCEVLKEVGTRRCFRPLQAIAQAKGGDEKMKKLAQQTMIDINRRLNTAAARGATPLGGGAAGTSQPTTAPTGTTRPGSLPRPTTRATGPSLW